MSYLNTSKSSTSSIITTPKSPDRSTISSSTISSRIGTEPRNDEILKSGYLWKKGKINPAFKYRYFRLYKNGDMTYAKDETAKVLGCIKIKDDKYTITATNFDLYFGFHMVSAPRKLEWKIGSKKESEGREWYELLNDVIEGKTVNANRIEVSTWIKQADCEIRSSDLSIHKDKKLGSGGSGTVFAGQWLSSKVAVKQLIDSMDENSIDQLYSEVLLLSKARHKNIVQMYGFCREENIFSLVCELIEGGSLADLIFDTQRELDAHSIARQIAAGMQYLHSKDIIHRDLKPGNILLTTPPIIVKICDFGLSVRNPRLDNNNSEEMEVGTPAYLAPEHIVHRPADVFSFGLIFWELIFRAPTFPDLRFSSQYQQVFEDNSKRPQIPSFLDHRERKLIASCWDADPDERPTFDSISSALQQLEVISPLVHLEYLIQNHMKQTNTRRVDWETAKIQFATVFGPHDFTPLKRFVCENDKEQTFFSLEKVTSFFEHFNPVVQPRGLYFNEKEGGEEQDRKVVGYSIDEVLTICQLNYFFGNLPIPKAQFMLKDKPPGTFLLRFSSSQKDKFALSVAIDPQNMGNWNLVYLKQNKHWIIEEKEFLTLLALLNYYKEEPLPRSPVKITSSVNTVQNNNM